jgi:type-F conjugative transfer system secretin TraK
MRAHNKQKGLSYLQWMGAVLALSLGSSQASQVLTSQILTLSENQRLEIAISPDSMNRIAVIGDRIAQVFGDEGTFVSQADEHTGQLFIKPSPENGTKPLSITVITENGVTQDLILKPTAKSATTAVFNTNTVRNSLKQGAFKEALSPMGETFQKALPFQEQLLLIMRQLIGGQLVESEEAGNYNHSTPEGFELEYSKSYQAGPYRGQVFSVQNTTATAIELLEKAFYCAGDLALSFEKRILMPGEKAQLFVVRSL